MYGRLTTLLCLLAAVVTYAEGLDLESPSEKRAVVNQNHVEQAWGISFAKEWYKTMVMSFFVFGFSLCEYVWDASKEAGLLKVKETDGVHLTQIVDWTFIFKWGFSLQFSCICFKFGIVSWIGARFPDMIYFDSKGLRVVPPHPASKLIARGSKAAREIQYHDKKKTFAWIMKNGDVLCVIVGIVSFIYYIAQFQTIYQAMTSASQNNTTIGDFQDDDFFTVDPLPLEFALVFRMPIVFVVSAIWGPLLTLCARTLRSARQEQYRMSGEATKLMNQLKNDQPELFGDSAPKCKRKPNPKKEKRLKKPVITLT